jgi:hypothetical protein
MSQHKPDMREGSFEDFKEWIRHMDERVENWEQLDKDIEDLCKNGEEILKGSKEGWNGERIPRSRVLIQFLFNI